MRLWLASLVMVFLPGLNAPESKPVTLPSETLTGVAICSGGDAVPKTPQILNGYGKGGFVITTNVPAAQAFFENGMQLGAAYAHKSSIAAFQEASRLDPACAMCIWGEALASGPNLNYGIKRADADKLAAMLVRAESLATKNPAIERALIAALKLRYAPEKKPGSANLAYARAMDAMAVAHPGENALATLAADAWLISSLGAKKDGTVRLNRSVALLEQVLARDPDYSPAIHFYIHATEIAKFPQRAISFADRLPLLAPQASHLIHMPSHSYYWIGRYQDAADANVRAVALGISDARRLGLPLPDGIWDLPLHGHNVHFGVGGALMSGDAKSALALSDPLVAVAATRTTGGVFSQAIAGMGYFAKGRFADPAAVMALPEPKLPYLKTFWRYARGEAQARLGNAAGVRAEAALIPWTVKSEIKGEEAAIGTRLTRIARLVLAGRAEMLDNRPEKALKFFRKAAAYEEGKWLKDFVDPPLWWYPVRRSIAEARLAAGDAAGALQEADATLGIRPKDPMTLSVRARAQAALGNRVAARRDARSALGSWRGDRRAFASALI